MDLNAIINNVVISRACSFKPDGDADDSDRKQVTLRIRFNNVALRAVFDKACATTAVQWQNGVARKNYDRYKNGQIVEIDFKAPATSQQDTMGHFIAEATAAGVDMNDKDAVHKYIMKRVTQMHYN